MEVERCPVCHSIFIDCSPNPNSDAYDANCGRCGCYSLTRPLKVNLDNRPLPKPEANKLSGWLNANSSSANSKLLTTTNITDLLNNIPNYKPREKQNLLLSRLTELNPSPGHGFSFDEEYDCQYAYAGPTEARLYFDELVARGLIERVSDDNSNFLNEWKITLTGWDLIEQIGKPTSNSRQGFVAMSFDASLKDVWVSAIRPAIENQGYLAYRIDNEPHNEMIDVRIMAKIKESRFLIADVTQQKNGVYFEAGYAMGLGIPVIWCCREADKNDIHFDTRQYNHILWENNEDLRTRLSDFISVIVGPAI